MSHYPILAKGPISHGSGDADRSVSTDPDAVSPLPPDIGPEAAVERVLSVLGRDQYLAARRLAHEAARRFPDHARVRKIAGIFDPRGKAVARPGGPRQPWLTDPQPGPGSNRELSRSGCGKRITQNAIMAGDSERADPQGQMGDFGV